MHRRMMKSKIHRATVTDANLHYVGSITLDTELMRSPTSASGAGARRRHRQRRPLRDLRDPRRPRRRVPQRCRRPARAARRQGDHHHLRRLRGRRSSKATSPRRARRHANRSTTTPCRPRATARRRTRVRQRGHPVDLRERRARPARPRQRRGRPLRRGPGRRHPRHAGRRADQGRAAPGHHPVGPGRRGRGAGEDPDSTDLHLADTLAAGAGLCDVDAVRVLVDEGPGRVQRASSRSGAMFDRDDHGRLELAREGGHAWPGVVHAGGAATGAEIERALVEAVRRTAAALHENAFALDLIVEGGRAAASLRSTCSWPAGRGAGRPRAAGHRRRRPALRRHHQPGRGHRRRHRHGAAGRGRPWPTSSSSSSTPPRCTTRRCRGRCCPRRCAATAPCSATAAASASSTSCCPRRRVAGR